MSSLKNGKEYWRSLDDLAATPEYRELVEREFPSLAPELLSESTRRSFLKVMGASMAMAGLTACRTPKEKILPYANRPEGLHPGEPVYFATTQEVGGTARGFLAKSFDGRPIKIEGNPNAPMHRVVRVLHGGKEKAHGATTSIDQASVLDLYDPDRLRSPRSKSGEGFTTQTWESYSKAIGDVLAKSGTGGKVRVLSESSASPSMLEMRKSFLSAFPQSKWFEYEPLSWDNETAGLKLAFGAPLRALGRFDRAKVIACFDADPFMDHPASIRYSNDFSKSRLVDHDGHSHMNRLWVAESGYGITGGMADHRFPVKSASIPRLLGALAHELFTVGKLTSSAYSGALKASTQGCASAIQENQWIKALAKDLSNSKGESLICVGAHQPAEVHALAHVLNAALDASGNTIEYLKTELPERPTHLESIISLSKEMSSGHVETLIILGGNPAFNAPADLDFAGALSKVQNCFHLTQAPNETSALCSWQLPQTHFLEAWSDGRGWEGTICIGQPLIAPLYGSRSSLEVIAGMIKDKEASGYAIVRRTFAKRAGAGLAEINETEWKRSLHNGVVADSRFVAGGANVSSTTDWAQGLGASAGSSLGGIEVSLVADRKLYDGRFSNNGWLQELPDPMTKITWENALLLGYVTAEKRGIKLGDVVTVEFDGRSIEVPVYPMPGQASDTAQLALGYGRSAAGRVGDGVGVNAYTLRTAKAPHVLEGCTITKTGSSVVLATTQDHHAIDEVGAKERDSRVKTHVRESDLHHYEEHPDFAKHMVHHPPVTNQLWPSPIDYSDVRKWGMSIDLSVCNGCSACVTACQAENNIAVVGKEEVDRGREMHWIRIDRYFSGSPETPTIANQPLTCQHCENAPCEQVCPVAATTHSSEGLNDMVYNRCVGTRYCLNNCPYKVRRFNWFLNTKDLEDIQTMVFNPDVTVRSRGVMEKCTFCVQRIRKEANLVRIGNTGDPNPKVEDGAIMTACEQACPTQAIIFGDLNDSGSRVAKAHNKPRSYELLSDLNTRPRTVFMAKITNPSIDLS